MVQKISTCRDCGCKMSYDPIRAADVRRAAGNGFCNSCRNRAVHYGTFPDPGPLREYECSFTVHYSSADGEYVGRCREFPSMSWLAPSANEAFVGITAAVAGVLADIEFDNAAPVPESASEPATVGS